MNTEAKMQAWNSIPVRFGLGAMVVSLARTIARRHGG